MKDEWIYLPVKDGESNRVGFSRKHVSELTELDKAYAAKQAALGPQPDKDIDGFIEYDRWVRQSSKVIQEYVNQF